MGIAPDAAFELFANRISDWWPGDRHSVSAGDGEAAQSIGLQARDGGEVFEIAHDGTRHIWGHIQEWTPGAALAMTWHPGQSPDTQTRVRVTFEADGDGTRVELTHSGWDALADGAAKRNGYNSGWDGVLARYAGAV